MDKTKVCRSPSVAALKACLVVGVFLLEAACGGDKSGSLTTLLPTDAASVQGAGASPSPAAVQVSVSPSLTPNFDPAIHDYVINCTSAPEVQFTALLNFTRFAFFGPADRVTKPFLYPLRSYQNSLALKPGQRFRFLIGDGTPEYSVRCLPADFPPLSTSINGTREAEWYLFAPTLTLGSAIPSYYVIVTDANGTPVWWKSEFGSSAMDTKIIGKNLIAWTVHGYSGQYVIRDFFGRIKNAISGNIDDHELQETPSGTYLAIQEVPRICPPDCADMSPWGGSTQEPVVDAQIVEFDSNSKVLWRWRTRDHIALAETGGTGWYPTVGNDIIHMNAVEPDGTNGLLFSARHLNAIYHITKSTGAVDWKIGGTLRPESLTVLGDTRPTSIGPNGRTLSGQHDVRKWTDGTVSVHDNGTNANRPPSVIRYQIDVNARTAEVVEEFQDVRVSYSICCGSARRLPGGHWLVDWGSQPFMTEVDSSGTPVLTVHYNEGAGFSYRSVPILPGTLSAETLRSGMDAMSIN